MQAVKAKINRSVNTGSHLFTCDNSGAKVIRIVSIFGSKTVKGKKPTCGVGDLVMASVRKGNPDMRKQVVFAVIVRQAKEYRRADGMRIKFEDTSAVVCKDEKGNPKGTLIKGPIAKEAAERWPAVSKLAGMIV